MNDNSHSPTVNLARELIRRDSVTPADQGCQDILATRLSRAGFVCTSLPFGDVTNLWACQGAGAPMVVFAGHTDVVPTGPESQWHHPPFEGHIENGMLHGRGSADMKGSLAAMVTAAERFVEYGAFNGSLAFLLTSDEEGPAMDGTKRVVEWLTSEGLSIDYCVVGEPSSKENLGDTIRIGRRGSLSGTLLIKGIQGHVAYPHLAENPIHRFGEIMTALGSETWDHGNQDFPPTSFQATDVSAGNRSGNVIPGELECVFNFRFSPESTMESLVQRVETICKQHNPECSITWRLSGMPFHTPHSPLIDATCDAIREITGLTPELSTGGGTSDGRFIAPTGAAVVELGPLNRTIHQLNEQVSTSDLDGLSRIYQSLMERLLR